MYLKMGQFSQINGERSIINIYINATPSSVLSYLPGNEMIGY